MCSVKMRQKVEREIADKVIECLLAANFLIEVNDGEEDVTVPTVDVEVIRKAMYSTDEDILSVYLDGAKRRVGYVHFIYGNSGHDVMHNWTTNLDEILKPAMDLADSYF
jgi:hypothetical protein